MIVQGDNDAVIITNLPDAVLTADSIYVAVVDTTGVLFHWNSIGDDILLDTTAKTMVCPWERDDTLNLPAGPIYIEAYARDADGNMFWSRQIPEYIERRYGNRGIGVKVSDNTAHGDIVSYDEEYDSTTKTLTFAYGDDTDE